MLVVVLTLRPSDGSNREADLERAATLCREAARVRPSASLTAWTIGTTPGAIAGVAEHFGFDGSAWKGMDPALPLVNCAFSADLIAGPTTTLTCPNGDVYLSPERNGFNLYLTMDGVPINEGWEMPDTGSPGCPTS